MAMSETAQLIFDPADKRVGISMIPVSNYSMILFFRCKVMPASFNMSPCCLEATLRQSRWFVN